MNRLNALKGIVELNQVVLNTFLNKYPNVNGHSNIEEAIVKDYDGFIIATPAKDTLWDCGYYECSKTCPY